jgi:predicted  nucleic acid-binding Zn-ribbon protein
MTPASDPIQALDRRMISGLKALGDRIAPLEKASVLAEGRHEQVMKKLEELARDVQALGDKADLANDRCDDLNTRVTVIERAWSEQMRPAIERLHSLELKVAGAALAGGVTAAGAMEIIRALLAK